MVIITRSFTVPRKYYPRLIMIDSLVKRMNATMKKTSTDKGCLFTIYFVTNGQAEVFDALMGSIIHNVAQY